ncbi:MAG: leucine-rich repeat protein [Acutalibacteraceae bacterium]
MKKIFKQLICLTLTICIVTGSIAFSVGELKVGAYSGTCGDGAQWSIDSGVLIISGVGTTGSYQAVSGSRSPWYSHKDEILYIKISEGITSVGVGSFQDCVNAVEVSLPESLKEISEMSFSGCNKLQRLRIPASVEKIDASAFLECSVLENISVDADNALFSDEDGVLFNKNKNRIFLFPKGKIATEYSIPEGVTEIGAYAFANCSELIRIDIPGSVNDIGMFAFMNCRTLLSANIPEGVTAIKSGTFFGCSGLYEVKLPSTVSNICSNAFGKCGSLMRINIPNATSTIDTTAFSGCPNLTVHCEKGSYANMYCIDNFIDYFYSNIASLFPMYYSSVYNGHTYGRFETSCTWQEAKLVCEMLGGHLATVTSAEEMTVIQSLLSEGTPDSYWLGATDEETEGTWKWITGEDFNYSLWGYGQPDNCGDVEDYLETWGRGSSWNDNDNYGNNTGATRGFVCEYEDFYSPDQTITYNGHIYSLYNESLTWTEAKAFCESIGGHLVTISDQAEQDAISSLFYLPKKWLYWIGFYDSNLDGTWEWVTGEPVTYTNWNTGEPNGATAATHTYAHMYSQQSGGNLKGCWNDECNDGYGTSHYRLANTGFICEVEPEYYSPLSGGYYNGNRYEVYNYNISWTDSQTFAQSKGGHLVTITDSQEASFVQQLYSDLTLSDEYINIGGFRYKHENKYRWVTGETFNYVNWGYNEPSNNQLVENFIQIYKYSNTWNDIGNKGSSYDGSVFIFEYESPKEVLTLSEPDGTVINRYKVQGGLPVDKPIKDYKPGYTAEWYKEPSLQNKWDFETDIITEDTTLYVYWVPNNYTVSFESNGGTCETDSMSVTYSNAYGELPSCSRIGYDFLGWFSNEDCTDSVDENSIVNIANNHTLYAGWLEQTVTSLKILSKPSKTDYYVGDSLDTTGLVITAIFSDGTTQDYDTGYSCSPEIFTRQGKYRIKVEFKNKTVYYYVTVKEPENMVLSVSSLPDKLEYHTGETFDSVGLELLLDYGNGITKEIKSGYTSEYDFNTPGTKYVTINYKVGETYLTTGFNVNVIESDYVIYSEPVICNGESFEVPIKVRANKGLREFSIDLSYDDSIIRPISAEVSNDLKGTFSESIDQSTTNTFNVFWNGEDVYYNDGTLFTVTFEPIANKKCETAIELCYNQTETCDENWMDATLNCMPIKVELIVPEAPILYTNKVNAISGETFEIPIYISNPLNLSQASICISYDRNAFSLVSVHSDCGTTLASNDSTLNIDWSGNLMNDDVLLTVLLKAELTAVNQYNFNIACVNAVFEGSGTITCQDILVNVQNQNSARIYCEYPELEPGEDIDVDIMIESNPGIMGFSLTVEFDPTILTFESVLKSALINVGSFDYSLTLTETVGILKLIWNNTENVSGNGDIFKLSFATSADDTYVSTLLKISYDENDTFNSNWDTVVFDCENAMLQKHIPQKYSIFWHVNDKVYKTLQIEYTKIIIPDFSPEHYNIVAWTPEIPELMPENELHFYALLEPTIYTATFYIDNEVISVQKYTVETEKLDEPQIPPKEGRIACWEYYNLKSGGDKEIHAIYNWPKVNLISQKTLHIGEKYMLIASSNFTATKTIWSSDNTNIAVVDNKGLVTAVGIGTCVIRVTRYGVDDLGNTIESKSFATIIVTKEKEEYSSAQDKFRSLFERFFTECLYDFAENLKRLGFILASLKQ